MYLDLKYYLMKSHNWVSFHEHINTRIVHTKTYGISVSHLEHGQTRRKMNSYKLLRAVVLFCVINEGLPRSTGTKSSRKINYRSYMKKVLERFEGIRLKAYDAQPNNPKVHDTTIGIGFNLNRPDAEKTFKKYVPGVDFNKVKSGKQAITTAQARALFSQDVDKIHEPRAINKVGKDVYDKLPSNVKAAVVNAVYKGDLGPKTIDLIKKWKWNKVGIEYLNNNEYKNADKLGLPGVKTRMDWNKKQFDTMVKP